MPELRIGVKMRMLRGAMAAMVLALAAMLAGTQARAAQRLAPDQGYWRTADSMASTITGDIVIRPQELTLDFMTYSLARVRALKPAEVSAVFSVVSDARMSGQLYRLRVPAAQRFAHKNTLCGGEETQWMATYVTGKTLEVAFFSGNDVPVFTFEAMQGSPARCGVFMYRR